MLGYRRLVRRRVIVNLTSGEALAGILLSQRGPLLVLADATYHRNGSQLPVDGEAVVERPRVAWIQIIPGTGS